jgi:hypothetical protein
VTTRLWGGETFYVLLGHQQDPAETGVYAVTGLRRNGPIESVPGQGPTPVAPIEFHVDLSRFAPTGAGPIAPAPAQVRILPIGHAPWTENLHAEVVQAVRDFGASDPLTHDIRAGQVAVRILVEVQRALDAAAQRATGTESADAGTTARATRPSRS